MPIIKVPSDVPVFASENEYSSHQSDLDYWWPSIIKVLEKHNLPGANKRLSAECGFNPTYPVFLIDNVVVKFFGHRPQWLGAFNTECAAHEYLVKDNTILAPRILAKGKLFANLDASWPYIISTKVSGKSWLNTNLTDEEKNKVAAEIGKQLRKIHKLPTDNQLKHDHNWSKLNFRLAAEKSILPRHLVAQVDDFLAKLDNFDRCFVNGDIVDTHVFIENGHLSGIIDWGDATITDRHYELGKLLDTFDWDKRLLKTVIETSNWPVKKNFSKQSLGLALYRQAVGLTQHNSFDVFYKLPNLLPLGDIATLDELANILFGV
jgi:hygromycin-B 7''-O-kinase